MPVVELKVPNSESMTIKPIWISRQKRAKYQNSLRVALPEKTAYLRKAVMKSFTAFPLRLFRLCEPALSS